MALILHALRVERPSGAVQHFDFTDGEQAAWISEVATKFRCRYVWWYRTAPDQPWRLRARRDLKLDAPELQPGGKFCPPSLAPLTDIGQGRPANSAVASTASRRSMSSKASGETGSNETGPGLEPVT